MPKKKLGLRVDLGSLRPEDSFHIEDDTFLKGEVQIGVRAPAPPGQRPRPPPGTLAHSWSPTARWHLGGRLWLGGKGPWRTASDAPSKDVSHLRSRPPRLPLGSAPQSIRPDDLETTEVLGRGASSIVWKARHKVTGQVRSTHTPHTACRRHGPRPPGNGCQEDQHIRQADA